MLLMDARLPLVAVTDRHGAARLKQFRRARLRDAMRVAGDFSLRKDEVRPFDDLRWNLAHLTDKDVAVTVEIGVVWLNTEAIVSSCGGS